MREMKQPLPRRPSEKVPLPANNHLHRFLVYVVECKDLLFLDLPVSSAITSDSNFFWLGDDIYFDVSQLSIWKSASASPKQQH